MPIRWFDFHLQRTMENVGKALQKVQLYNDGVYDPKLQDAIELLNQSNISLVAMVGVNENMKDMVEEAESKIRMLK